MTDVNAISDPEPTANCYGCGAVTEEIDDDELRCPDCDSVVQWIAGGQADPIVGNCLVCGGVEDVARHLGGVPRCPDCYAPLQWVTESVGGLGTAQRIARSSAQRGGGAL